MTIKAIEIPFSIDVGSIHRQPITCAGTPIIRETKSVVPEKGEIIALSPQTPA